MEYSMAVQTNSGPAPVKVPSRRDWWQTVRQSLPHAGRVLSHLRPTFRLRSIGEMTPEFVERHGIRGILWDVDGTLTHYHARELAPEARAAAERLFSEPGLRHAVVSNCDDVRFFELGRMLPGVPILKLYEGNGQTFGRRLDGDRETWWPDPSDPSLLQAIRKPSADLIRFAVRELALDRSTVVMVGDQNWTDIAGANLAGVRSVRVPTAGRSSFPLPLRILQRIEGGLLGRGA
jgi:hypothetical protein